MSENKIFDKTPASNPSGADGKTVESSKMIDNILREYDAKKAATDQKKDPSEEKSYETSAFLKELEALEGTNTKKDEPTEDYDDSDMKIAPSTEDIPFDIEPSDEQEDEPDTYDADDVRKLDIMNAISKHFEAAETASEPKEEVSEAPIAELSDTEKEDFPVGDPSDTASKKRLGIDDVALEKAFNDDLYDNKKKKKKKEKIKLDEDGETMAFAPVTADDSNKAEDGGKRRRYDENGYRIPHTSSFFSAKEEYTKNTDKSIVFGELRNKLLFSCLALVLVLVLLFISFYTEIAPSIGLPHISALEQGKTGVIFLLFDLQILFFAVILKLNSICKGAVALFTGTPASESVTFISVVAAALHTLTLAIADPTGDQFAPVCSVALLSVLLLSLSDFFKARAEFMSFRIISSEGEKYSFKDISESADTTPDEIAKFVPHGTKILDIRKADFASGFFDKIKKPIMSEKTTAIAIYIALCVALIGSIAYCVLNKEAPFKAVCCFSAVVLTSVQSCMLICSSLPGFIFADKASRRKCAFIGNNICEEFSNISVVSFKDTEVFSPDKIRVSNIRTYGTTRIDNVIVTMAKIFGTVGGPLSSVFANSITGIDTSCEVMKMIDIAPDGLWVKIDGVNYYVGTSSYMAANNFDTNEDMADRAFSTSGGGILYLASTERVLAKFYINYEINPGFVQILKKLYERGICARIKTLDPCINNDFIRSCLRRPESLFSVVKAPYADEVEKTEEVCDSSMVSSAGENSLIRSFLLLSDMKKIISINNKLKFLALGLSLALSAFALVVGSVILPTVVMMLIQLFWLVPVFITAKTISK